MPDLKAGFFEGNPVITPEWINRLSSTTAGLGLRDALSSLGWKGESVATISLLTSPDGTRVTNGVFNLWGTLSAETIEFQASKLWEGTHRNTTIRIQNLQGQAFRFSSGQLQSDYLDSEHFEISVTRAGQDIAAADWAANGVGHIALRAIAHIDKTANRADWPLLKVTILAVPLSADEIAALSERTHHPAWPGIRVLECRADLFPRPTEAQWGCPIWPFICTRNREANINTIPSPAHLQHAIAEMMRTAALPTACGSRGALNEKGQAILDAGDDPEIRRPSITWPECERPPPDRGNHIYLLYSTSQSGFTHTITRRAWGPRIRPISSFALEYIFHS